MLVHMNNRTTIEVLSSVMGSGKTSYLIDRMKPSEAPIIYIAPYLEECQRVAKACAGHVHFHEPSDKKTGVAFANYAGPASKTKHLRRLLQAGESVAASHSLFHHLRPDMLQSIQAHGYVLVMDEVISVAKAIKIRGDQVDELIESDVLTLGPVKSMAKRVMQIYAGENEDRNLEALGKGLTVGDLRKRAKAGRLMSVDGKIVFWMFPLNFFQAFSSVTVATYLFDGSHLRRYYDLHDLDYRVRAVTKRAGQYTLIRPQDFNMTEYLAKMRRLIHIVDAPHLNGVGEERGSLSYTWWTSQATLEERVKFMQGKIRSFLKYAGAGWNRKEHFLFTSFKDVSAPDKKTGKRPDHLILTDHQYISPDCFLAHNTRATNEFINKKSVAYLINRFMDPLMVQGFKLAGVEINEDHYALSEMLQFIYRSRIRKGQSIKVWIPSSRMRDLMERWLVGEIQ